MRARWDRNYAISLHWTFFFVAGLTYMTRAVHCRRRKIRCLVAADDAQGRCENCIRLRKECQFYPVDQQPPIEKKPRSSSSRLDTQSADTSSTTPISSSPTNLSTEPVDAFYPYPPQIPLNTSGPDMSFNPGAFAGSSMSGMPGTLPTVWLRAV